jgi:hypothetical protein
MHFYIAHNLQKRNLKSKYGDMQYAIKKKILSLNLFRFCKTSFQSDRVGT